MPADTRTCEPPAAGPLRARISEAYARQSRAASEEKWITDNLPLVRHIVQKVASQLSSRQDTEDLVSAGALGLVKAARAYDPAKDAQFGTYAYIRVRGAVIDELRNHSFVPPKVYREIRRVRKAHQSYLARHGRAPGDEQLAAELGVSVGRLYRSLEEARRQHFLSIHGLIDQPPSLGSLAPLDRRPSPADQAEKKEMIARLSAGIASLPERDRLVLLLYYERDLTMKEAAQVLGLTEGRVSQLHAGALFKLAMRLGANR